MTATATATATVIRRPRVATRRAAAAAAEAPDFMALLSKSILIARIAFLEESMRSMSVGAAHDMADWFGTLVGVDDRHESPELDAILAALTIVEAACSAAQLKFMRRELTSAGNLAARRLLPLGCVEGVGEVLAWRELGIVGRFAGADEDAVATLLAPAARFGIA